MFSKGDQLKIKLANLNFSEIGDGCLFLDVFSIWGTFSNRRKGLYIYNIYIYFKIYIKFRGFGGICCGGILTLQKDKGLVAPAQQVGKFDQTIFEHFYPHLPA